jgi:hypothetical protein
MKVWFWLALEHDPHSLENNMVFPVGINNVCFWLKATEVSGIESLLSNSTDQTAS